MTKPWEITDAMIGGDWRYPGAPRTPIPQQQVYMSGDTGQPSLPNPTGTAAPQWTYPPFKRCAAYDAELRKSPEYEKHAMTYEEWRAYWGRPLSAPARDGCVCPQCQMERESAAWGRSYGSADFVTYSSKDAEETRKLTEHLRDQLMQITPVPIVEHELIPGDGIMFSGPTETSSVITLDLAWREIACPQCRRVFCEAKVPVGVDIEVRCPGCIAEGRQTP